MVADIIKGGTTPAKALGMDLPSAVQKLKELAAAIVARWSIPLLVTELATELFDCSRRSAPKKLTEMGDAAKQQPNRKHWVINLSAYPEYLDMYEKLLRKKSLAKRLKGG